MMEQTTHASLLADVRVFLTKAMRQHGPVARAELEAWDRFFDVYNDILLRFAARLKMGSQEREDLTQDVWCRVIQDLPRYEYDPTKGGFRRWLFTIVHCRAIDHARYQRARAGTKKKPESSGSLLTRPDAARLEEPVDELDRQFKTEVVRAAIGLLQTRATAAEWDAFRLCRLEGASGAEAARQLGIQPAALRKRLERSLGRLREVIVELVGTADAFGP